MVLLRVLLVAGILALVAPVARCQQQEPVRLTLGEAMQRGMQANLSAIEASTRTSEAEGARERKRAALLPRVSADAMASVQNRNLRAFGISLPSLPTTVGPFSNYDVRATVQQNVFDLQSYRGWKASAQSLETARISEREAREGIVRAVAALCLQVQSQAARVEAARSRVSDAERLLKLARDKHDAGTATGVDVLRAEVELANDRQTLLENENEREQALLALARNLGMDVGRPVELTDRLRFADLPQTRAESLTASALAARADYLALASQRKSLVLQQQANRARWMPKLTLNGNVGELGRSVGSMTTTGSVQGQIDFTLYDRDREGETQELAARLRRVEAQMEDLRRGVEEEIREALLALDSAHGQVEVAEQGQKLARRELEQSRDRFEAGTTNNVEVVTAQNAVSRADENLILAITRHVDAKCSLARAMGEAEKRTLAWMSGASRKAFED